MTALFPKIKPFNSFKLKVSDLHTLHVEEAGTQGATPVVFIHGGPGGGIEPSHYQNFDPERWHIIHFDQRGAGQSTPHACLEANTTWDLVADIETIRNKMELENWHVFGGSWGSTLALAYAIKHPSSVLSLTLRGIFMLRKSEIDWYYQAGAHNIYPDAWEHYLAPIPENERENLVPAYYKRLTSDDLDVRLQAAKAWSVWEGSTSKLLPDPQKKADFEEEKFATAFARIECHYFINGGFFETDAWILENVYKIRHIPSVIVQGRYDMPCPMRSAWDLHKAWPEAEFHMIDDAGHASSEPGIASALVEATNGWLTSSPP